MSCCTAFPKRDGRTQCAWHWLSSVHGGMEEPALCKSVLEDVLGPGAHIEIVPLPVCDALPQQHLKKSYLIKGQDKIPV